MHELLTGEFGWDRHPLISSIDYHIESLQNFYLKYLETRELLSTFGNNIESVFMFFDTKNYENFFLDKFLIDKSKKEELRTFKDERGHTIFEIIDFAANNLTWIGKTKKENAQNFGSRCRRLHLKIKNIK
jgi:hypothetical protein